MRENGLSIAGAIFLIVGGCLIFWGFTSPTANLELMHIQSMELMLGIGAGIVSAILIVGGSIIEALNRRG